MEPITGVMSANKLAWEYMDEEICPTCEEYFDELDEKISKCSCEGEGCDLCDEWTDEIELSECFDHTKLIGDWKKDEEGLYIPDEEKEFAAILTSSTFNCVQVVWSKFTTNVRAMCSPCFPGQADLDSGEGDITAYCLPEYLIYKEGE